MDLNHLLTAAIGSVKEAMATTGEVIPFFIGHPASGPLIAIQFTPSPEHKEKALAVIGQIFRESGVVAYTTMNEAWMRRVGPHSDLRVRPSQAEDRVEIVVVTAISRNEKMGRIFEIIRNADGSYKELVDMDGDNDAVMGGSFTELLSEPG